MTEVAQVAAVVAHDMNDAADENDLSDTEDKEVELTNESVNEKSGETSLQQDQMSHQTNDETSDKTAETQVNGVGHKDTHTAIRKRERSRAVNGTEKENENPDTREDESFSELALKKEVSQRFYIWYASHLDTVCFTCLNKQWQKYYSTETTQVQETSGQKLRAEAERRKRVRDEQVWSHAEGPGGA